MSSYEMHKDAMKKFRDRAERAEAELERVRNSFNYPELVAGNADALAFQVEQGKPFAGIKQEALALWLRSVANSSRELHKALAHAKEAGL